MRKGVIIAVLGGALLSACASTEGEVALVPQSALVIDNGPVGPFCDETVAGDKDCAIDGAGHRKGKSLLLANDAIVVGLSRDQRERYNERDEAIKGREDVRQSLETGAPIPANSHGLPKP